MNGNPTGRPTISDEKADKKLDCRVPESLKTEFYAICHANGFVPGALNRRLVEELVAEYRVAGPVSLEQYREPLTLPEKGKWE